MTLVYPQDLTRWRCCGIHPGDSLMASMEFRFKHWTWNREVGRFPSPGPVSLLEFVGFRNSFDWIQKISRHLHPCYQDLSRMTPRNPRLLVTIPHRLYHSWRTCPQNQWCRTQWSNNLVLLTYLCYIEFEQKKQGSILFLPAILIQWRSEDSHLNPTVLSNSHKKHWDLTGWEKYIPMRLVRAPVTWVRFPSPAPV